MKSNRWVVDLLRLGLLALALVALSLPRAFADDDDDDDGGDKVVLKWKTMAAVQRPYLGAVNPVDGVGGGIPRLRGGSRPWATTEGLVLRPSVSR